MRLIDQIIAKTPEFAALLKGLAANTSDLPQRLEKLQPLIDFEHATLDNPADHLHFYCSVAYHCLTDAFILTQRQAALRRIETSENPIAKDLLAQHACAQQWISVGISHLTTSRQHLGKPVVSASPNAHGWKIRGTVPWVTAASGSQALVIAACDANATSTQYLFYLPMNRDTVQCGPSMNLLALEDSCTCEVHLHDTQVSHHEKLHGPSDNVLSISQSSGAGGLQTTALALGLAACVIDHIKSKCSLIHAIREFDTKFHTRWIELYERMNHAASTHPKNIDPAKLRKDANDLVVRVTQAALAIEKGAGFLAQSDTARWVREAMFFLVWSCPQSIANEHLCDLSHFEQFAAINVENSENSLK